ncbi:Sir2 family NAD-dependent protein deacetylase [Pseudoclavibacter sp. RFBA6]|uniref:Sir2 family NAD-dependent protein deacetylase n=1 Tax=Pseudoclavibacter sp. RFBA6 TaxID=2080573 RepID=UPI000CE75C6D|nr:Sir2 family NAD-dependent protein deacetylase [Pseudoclavibacter sp. RFBA6]PPG40770.1 NAD-dependent deacetylase [Pseudoclavibacter sp. RFBA6]
MEAILSEADAARAARTRAEGLARAADLLSDRTFAVLTGAGLSTDSGIPDYRGDGKAPRISPMTIQQFMSDEATRRRYWAGAALGAARFSGAEPNAGHLALAELEHHGAAAGVATQNVDGLHLRAGSRNVVELHGSMRTASCTRCGHEISRAALLADILASSPGIAELAADASSRPDGDAEASGAEIDELPSCPVCGGILQPDVVMFGDVVRPSVAERARQLVDEADALLVAGTSLVVNTGRRLVHRAAAAKKPVVLFNRGDAAIGHLASVYVEGGTSESLVDLAGRLTSDS